MHLLSGVDTPGERITRERVIGYLQSLEGCGNATQTIMARLQELYEAALVMDPRQDWQWIRNIAAIVRSRHIPARDKRSRIVGDEQLVDLGFSLIEGAEAENTDRRRALAYRDGLLIALLALRPAMRRRGSRHLPTDRYGGRLATDSGL